jgi:hypothetical protein
MVPAVVGAYQCNGTVDWLEEEHPYYPPTVNDPGAAEFAKGVVGRLLGASNVSDWTGWTHNRPVYVVLCQAAQILTRRQLNFLKVCI